MQRLLDDVIGRLAVAADAPPHFLGSIVLLDEPDVSAGPDGAMILDGQQRLITLCLAIARCERRLPAQPTVLSNEGLDAVDRPRIVAADVDDADFSAVLNGRDPIGARPLRNAVAVIDDMIATLDPAAVRAAILDRVQAVRILLDRREDAEAVFESLNTTGQPLTQSDLVRTTLLSCFETVDKQRRVDAKYWRPAEERLRAAAPEARRRERQSPKDRVTTDYLRALLMRDGGRVDGGRLYRTFIDRIDRSSESADAFLATFEQLSHAYVHLLPPPATTPSEMSPHHVMRRLGYTVHHPLFLQIHERASGPRPPFPQADVDQVMADIESLVIRRAAVGWTTHILGRLFEDLCAACPADHQAIWAKLTPHWPSDERFAKAISERPLYQEAPNAAWIILARLDAAEDAKDSALDDDASLEHVMPQSIGDDASGRDWRSMLGPGWKDLHVRRLHTLPNLTLTRRNSEMSNRSFEHKRPWLRESKFAGTRRIGSFDRWDDAAMEARAARLTERALKLWPLPDQVQGV